LIDLKLYMKNNWMNQKSKIPTTAGLSFAATISYVKINSLFEVDLIEHKLRVNKRYQRGNQNPYIEEEQTTQWPTEKVQKDKQRSTKHTQKTKDRGK